MIYQLIAYCAFTSMAKFWHYTVWAESKDNGAWLDLRQGLSDDAFEAELNKILEKEEKNYYIDFRHLGGDHFHGWLSRVKDEDSFIHRGPHDDDFNNLSDETGGGGEAGERDSSTAEFGLVRRTDRLHILMEQAGATPGIGFLLSYLKENVDISEDFELKKRTSMGPDAEEVLDELMGKELKSVEIKFKKNPTTYSELDIDSAIDTMTPDDYKFHFGVSLERGNTEAQDTEEGISKVFNTLGLTDDSPNQPITNSVRQLDIPKMMSTFEIVAKDGEQEIDENLADTIGREEVDTNPYGYFDERLGQRLCELIEEEHE